MAKKMKEKDLYPIVEAYLKRYYRCFKTAADTGLNYSRVDVVGIRDVGGELSGDIEIIVVEVKKGTQPFATASGQASGYKVYANKVYLADLREKPFNQDEIQIASHLGIGLIQIKSKKCKEVLTSPHYANMPKMAFALLEKIRIGQCQFCGSFFEIGNDSNRYSKLIGLYRPVYAQKVLKKAFNEEKGLLFYNYEVWARRFKATRLEKHKEYSYERRFVCPTCIQTFFFSNEND